MATCTACQQPIIFATTLQGNAMPVNPGPDPAGNLALHRDERGQLWCRALAAGEQPRPFEKRAMPHWADNCGYRPAREPAAPSDPGDFWRGCPLCSRRHAVCRFAAGSLYCTAGARCANPHHHRRV